MTFPPPQVPSASASMQILWNFRVLQFQCFNCKPPLALMDCGDPTRGAMVNLHLTNPKWFCQLVGFSNFIMLSSFSAPYARPCSAPALPRLPAGGKDRRKRRTGGKGTEGGKGRKGGRGRKEPTRGARADLPPKKVKSCCQLVGFLGVGA